MKRMLHLARRLAARTPADRDRYLDFLRVAALLLVVLGHWLVRVVIAPDGAPEAHYLLALQPGWQAATPLFQVMPLFFLVGGVVNLRSWRRARAEGRGATEWLRGRAQRLLTPAVPLVLGVAALGLGAEVLAPGRAILDPWIALIPLWFLAAYLAVTALTPWSAAMHARGHSPALIAVAAGLALGVDLLRLSGVGPVAGTQPLVGLPNFVLVWGAVHQLGHMWIDGRLPARPLGQFGLAAAGVGTLAVLIGALGWPLSMVPVAGTLAPNNAAPPTVALLALAGVQTGLALSLRAPAERWLARPIVWAAVALAGARLMTLFLWHQMALVVAVNVAVPAGWLPLSDAVDLRYWLLRPVWLGAAALVLAGIVAAMGRLERGRGAPLPGGAAVTLLGVGLVAAGLAALLWAPLAPPGTVTAAAVSGVALFATGCRALGITWRRTARRA